MVTRRKFAKHARLGSQNSAAVPTDKMRRIGTFEAALFGTWHRVPRHVYVTSDRTYDYSFFIISGPCRERRTSGGGR